MSTLLNIKKTVASYFEVTLADLTVNGVDLFLGAATQVVKTAEMNHDFEFNRKLVTVTVDGATGGDLEDAVDAANNAVDVKTVLEVGLLDAKGNLIPVTWTTVSENIERQRIANPGFRRLWLRDDEAEGDPIGGPRFTFSGSEIRRWPQTTDSLTTTFDLWLEVYAFSPEWANPALGTESVLVTGATGVTDVNTTYYRYGYYNNVPFYLSKNPDAGNSGVTYSIWFTGVQWVITEATDFGNTAITNYHKFVSLATSPVGTYNGYGTFTGTAAVADSTTRGLLSEIWTIHGQQYLQWATIIQLNYLFKHFVFRQEGNLPPPKELADAGLATLLDWDNSKYEQFRRHNR